MKEITDVFFDLDHTLWDFDKNSEITYDIIFNKHAIPVGLTDFLKAYMPINRQLWQLYRNGKVAKEELRFTRLRRTFDSLGATSIANDQIHLIADEYITYLSQQKHLIAGALPLLEYLKPKYKLHIITNGFQEVQQHKLKNSAIGSYFDVVVNSDMAGVKKPNPEIFNLALTKANVSAKHSIMIGDDLEADVHGAKNMGMEAILFNYHQDAILDENVTVVSSLNDIKQFL